MSEYKYIYIYTCQFYKNFNSIFYNKLYKVYIFHLAMLYYKNEIIYTSEIKSIMYDLEVTLYYVYVSICIKKY